MTLPTSAFPTALPLLIHSPLWRGADLIADHYSTIIENLTVVNTAFGGYWSLKFRLNVPAWEVDNWLVSGLGRHIELYSPGLELIWEGFVSTLNINVGSLTLSLGPLLRTVKNKVKVAFSTVDTSVTPPAVGVRTSTDWAEDTISQTKYGIIESVESLAGANITSAEQLRDLVLEENKDPRPTEKENLTSSTTPNVTIGCEGYFSWLDAYTLDLTTTGDQNASAKIEAVLAADPNGIFSTSYGLIDENISQVGAYDRDDRPAIEIIKGIVGLGDTSGTRWLFGFYKNRIAKYAAIPTDVAYNRALAAPDQRIESYGARLRVNPWSVVAGQWVFYSDLLVGRSPPDEMRADPRYLFIENATYRVPWGLTLAGSKVDRVSQKLARMGLGGQSA